MDAFLLVCLAVCLVYILAKQLRRIIYGLDCRKVDTSDRVEVHVDPKDKAEDFVAGGKQISRNEIANLIYPHPAYTRQLSQTYRPLSSVSARDYSRYHYNRKSQMMTRAERAFYKRLEMVFPEDCYIFPQVHLDDILEATQSNRREDWLAKMHVRQKSVDYVICDRDFRVRLAIELDDWSHDLEMRKNRDNEVERVFRDARLPLLRCRNINKISDTELKLRIVEEFRTYSPSAQ